MFRTACLLLLAAAALAQGHHRTRNRALLGIVVVPVEQKSTAPHMVIAHVLEESPAAAAGLTKGDVLLSIAGKRITKPQAVDAVLRGYAGTEKIAIKVRRGGAEKTVEATLMERKEYRGAFLQRQRRGATKIKASPWFVYAWAQAGKAPPTFESTKDKVVVIHCFQSW